MKDEQFMPQQERMMRIENDFAIQQDDNSFAEPGDEDKKLPLVPDHIRSYLK